MCADTEITHLAYADDLLLFARGDESTIAMIADCLQDFGDMAGLRANPLKSSIYFAGVDPRTRDTLLALTGFQQGGFPFRYLGIPLATEKLRISNYGALIDAAEVNIMAQTYIILCREARIGKDGLARSGIWLSILPIPNGVIDKLYAICRSFVWSTKHPPIYWATICLSKEEGGYGVRDLHAWNSALLCRALWNIQRKKDSLWVRWIHHHYLRRVDLWQWQSKALYIFLPFD